MAGFQWIDGSFAEHVETLEQRGPEDVDVVTFYRMPAPQLSPEHLARVFALFSREPEVRERTLAEFRVDGYPVDLAMPPKVLVVATLAASGEGTLRERGPIPNRDRHQLLITATTQGSFGFELQEHVTEPLVSGDETPKHRLCLAGKWSTILPSEFSDVPPSFQ